MALKSIGSLLALILLAAPSASASEQGTAAESAFARIKSLVGEWQGESVWSGARSGGGPATARYTLTGGKATVVESLYYGSDTPSMTSTYHMDNGALRMTHFCAARNQPRLRATAIETDEVHFEFLDITNLADADTGHVRAVDLDFVGPKRLRIRFRFVEGDRVSFETLDLERVSE